MAISSSIEAEIRNRVRDLVFRHFSGAEKVMLESTVADDRILVRIDFTNSPTCFVNILHIDAVDLGAEKAALEIHRRVCLYKGRLDPLCDAITPPIETAFNYDEIVAAQEFIETSK